MNIINGKFVSQAETITFLNQMEEIFCRTLSGEPLLAQTVIAAADALSKEISFEKHAAILYAHGMDQEAARRLLNEAKVSLSKEYLTLKLERELGKDAFAFHAVDGCLESFRPLGVLTHIAAGNAAGLPALSVLEGLLCGNINLLKLPGADDGLSTLLLKMLIDIEPCLARYIYVFDLPSTDEKSIRALLSVSDAAAVWGSDFAVQGIRRIAPPNLTLIEWGHKLSFAYVTPGGESAEGLASLAQEICRTEQLLCSSPQCVYYETDSIHELTAFAKRFALTMERLGAPSPVIDSTAQAEITMALSLAKMEEILGEKRVIEGNGFSLIVEQNKELCPSPMYRTVLVKPASQAELFSLFRKHKGYLQTVGLLCEKTERALLQEAFLKCGCSRVVLPGSMSDVYAGEPHDGQSALRRYTKRVTVCR